MDGGLYIVQGKVLYCTSPGWMRLVFTVTEKELDEGEANTDFKTPLCCSSHCQNSLMEALDSRPMGRNTTFFLAGLLFRKMWIICVNLRTTGKCVTVCVYLPSCIIQGSRGAHSVLSPYLHISNISLNLCILVAITTSSFNPFQVSSVHVFVCL